MGDFSNTWSGGALVLAGKTGVLFDHEAYNQWLRTIFGAGLETREWSYPPSLLLLSVPLARLPLFGSYVVWTLGTLGCFWMAMRAGGLSLPIQAAALASAGVFINILFGQNGALTAALLVGGLLQTKRRPIVSGVLFGLLTIKPHLGVLIPVVLLATRNWRGATSAAATTILLVTATAWIFGWDVWVLFLSRTEPMMRSILDAPYPGAYLRNAVTIFMTARAAGATLSAAYAAQAAAAIAAAIVTWRAWRKPDADVRLLTALTVCLTFLATPYCWHYDLVAYSAALAIIIAWQGWRVTFMDSVAWLWPVLTHIVSFYFFPLSPLILTVTAWTAWSRLSLPEPAGIASMAGYPKE